MKLLRKSCLAAFVLGAIAVLFGVATDNIALWRPAVVLAAIGLSIGLGALQRVAGYQFTSWIFTCVVVGMCYPSAVLHWGDFDLRHPWLILIAVQMVMFGMGTQMGLRDFAGEVERRERCSGPARKGDRTDRMQIAPSLLEVDCKLAL